MDSFLRFAAGVVIAVVYTALAGVVGIAVNSAAPNLAGVCAAVVFLGWVAIIIVAFRKEQRWVGYGVLAAPFIALLVATISCFAQLNAQTVTPGSITGIFLLP
jgi:hypothetical protein